MPTPPLERTTITRDAQEDLGELKAVDVELVKDAYRMIVAVDRGSITPRPLTYMGKTGDLTDCSKVYFGPDDAYRIVFQEMDDQLHIREVVVIEERTNDLPCLLAGLRLGRLDETPVRRSDAQRAVHRTRENRRGRGES